MKIKELLKNRWKWTKGAFARTWYGTKTEYYSSNASRFCLLGALLKCYNFDFEEPGTKIELKIGGTISEWNDNPDRTFAEVKQLVEELDI
ncbi:MAG: hypothetical protein ACHQ1D_00560 [Nitrososphaerales archaeon]